MNKPVHAPQTQFPTVDGCLQIGGVPLTRLAARVGSTPFYAYSRDALTDTVKKLREALPAGVRLHYSLKANPMPALVQHMASLVDGLDVASAGELKIALDTPMKPAAIQFAGPGKTDTELAQAVAAGIAVSLESAGEAGRIARIGEALGMKPSVLVRVNPEFELKSSGMRMGGGAKQFGIDSEQVPAVLKQIAGAGLDFHGFHIFAGSQSLKADAIIEAQARTAELALRLSEHAPSPVRTLNIGGGFGIPYFPGETPLDVEAIGAGINDWLPKMRSALPQAEVVIELGRYLVGGAGVYVTRVIDRKVSRGEVFLVADGGMNHHLAASGNLGQVIRKNYPVEVGNRMSASERETVTVTGPLCTPLDTLADRMDLPKAEVGDLIVVFQSGAYGLSASPTGFLGHPRAVEVLV